MGWFSKLFGKKPISRQQESTARRSLVPANWTSSPAHLVLLERFLSVRDAESGVPDFWEPMFGAQPQRVVDEMIELRLLEHVPLPKKVVFCHTGAELKKKLSSRGLKVSGKKVEQAQRLIESDPEGMEKLYRHRKIVRCVPAVSQIVMDWTDAQARLFDAATEELIAALRDRDLKTAVNVADAYRERKFHPPNHPAQDAMTIKLPPRSLGERAEELATIFTMRPKILSGLRPEQWVGLHLNYIVWQLMGRSAPEKCIPGFTGFGAMDRDTVTRMLAFYVRHQGDLARWRELGIKNGTIFCCNSGSCDACIALDQRIDRLDKLPELPYRECTCALGCRCLVNPVLDI